MFETTMPEIIITTWDKRRIMSDSQQEKSTLLKWGKQAYRFRSVTPVPLLIAAIWLSNPSLNTIIIGSILAVIGEGIRMLAMFETHNKTSTRGKVASSDALVATGIYTYTRNPLYLGALFTGLGYMVVTGCVIMVAVFLVLFAVQYYLIIRYEEDYLRGKFPADFEEFFSSNPRFFPRFKSTGSPITIPNFALLRGALYRERSTILGLIVVISLLAYAPEIRALFG